MTDEQFESEDWKALRQERSAKREHNRENSAQILTDRGVTFTSRNGGAHLIIEPGLFDFWPGTGRWVHRKTGKKGFGVRSLLAEIEAQRK